MKILHAAAAAVSALAVVSFTAAHRSIRAAEAPVTWSRQIAPIVYSNCAMCHHPGGAGPFSLLSYAEARRHAPQILDVTQSRYMPPWLPEPGYGDFAGERRLSEEDLALVRKWVEAGTPQGDPGEA